MRLSSKILDTHQKPGVQGFFSENVQLLHPITKTKSYPLGIDLDCKCFIPREMRDSKGACKYYISMLGGVGVLKEMLILLMWLGGSRGKMLILLM